MPTSGYSSSVNSCTTCGTAYTNTATGQSGADPQAGCICAAGYGRTDKTTTCDICTVGNYKTGTGDSVCTDCSAGDYMPTSGYSSSVNSCTTCGTAYTNTATGQSGANPQAGCICAAGYGRTDKNTICDICTVGNYKTVTGDSVCTGCSAGDYMPIAGYSPIVDSCITCGTSYTNTATGQSGANPQAGCICDEIGRAHV